MMSLKTCRKCGEEKSDADFHKRRKSIDGLNSYCKACRAAIDSVSYKEKESRRAAIRARSDKVRDYNSRLLARYKRIKTCASCGENEPVSLDLHHINDDKVDSPSRMRSYSTASLKAEIRKCVVVCANCHRKIHAGILEL